MRVILLVVAGDVVMLLLMMLVMLLLMVLLLLLMLLPEVMDPLKLLEQIKELTVCLPYSLVYSPRTVSKGLLCILHC